MGPTLPLSKELHATKYRGPGESFEQCARRLARTLSDNSKHEEALFDIFGNMRFLPAGRIQSAIGSPRKVTPYNCFVSATIPDSMDGIMDAAKTAAQTMRMGGGIGYDFSTLRPRGDRIVSLDSASSGPLSFMEIFDATCRAISSAGHRRGAQMGVLRVDHPDIEEFVKAKNNQDKLRGFNTSIAITDEFMKSVVTGGTFTTRFKGREYRSLNARALWEDIMRSTWDWAEPGVLFIDRINQMNNLHYCETIAATNPCAEQPLPPNGACLLGSFNLVKYLTKLNVYHFNATALYSDIRNVVRAMDNVIDVATYPLPEQAEEAWTKRRMGLGVTGLANAAEILGYSYGSPEMVDWTKFVLKIINNAAYAESVQLAKEKGTFALYDKRYLESAFVKRALSVDTQEAIAKFGIRNSHLTSIAPTGTISLCADNVSSGIEPPFSLEYDRTIMEFDGSRTETVKDYAWGTYGIKGKTAADCSVDDHVNVLIAASRNVDSAVSKTVNCTPDMPWADFKNIYMSAWHGGAKGCTTFNSGGKRFGILNAKPASEEEQGAACYIDAETGKKTCE
jgi:ribonucleoside-diphosphate reductase alpha chain